MQLARLRKLVQQVREAVSRQVLGVGLPETCAGCGRTGAWFCDGCLQDLSSMPKAGCHRCGRRGSHRQQCWRCSQLFPRNLRQVRAGFDYEGPMRQAIQKFKYQGEYQRGYDLGSRLAERLAASRASLLTRVDVIVPVPLHPRRYRSRGFNQSEILAECISDVLRRPVVNAVERKRNTIPQVKLRADRRLENLEQAFEIDPAYSAEIVRRNVLLVDDVMTTGATLAAVAASLAPADVREVVGLTLAREQ